MNHFNHFNCVSLVAVIVVCSLGCGGARLANEQVLDLDSNDIRTFLIEPTDSEQNVTVVATTDGPPIEVFVYLSEDDEAVDYAIMHAQTSDKVIASQSDSANVSLSAKIPANKEASVRLQTTTPNAAKVTLSISN